MGLKDFFFKADKPTQAFAVENPSIPEAKNQAFSTPFLKIGKGNLGQPFISPFYTISGITQFGTDNLYPQTLDQMYYTSAIHSSCINFISNTTVGGGYTYALPFANAMETVDMYTFEKINRFPRMVRELVKDFIIHRRVCVLVLKDKTGKFKSFKRIHPAYIRNAQDLTSFVWCNDWSRRTNMKEYPRYDSTDSAPESLYVYQAESIGQDIYPLPTYISIMNDAFLDGEIAFLQKSNIQNSIWPSMTIRVPKVFQSAEEMEMFRQGLIDNSGAQNAGKIMVLTGQGMENTPDAQSLRGGENDKLFDSTLDSIMNKICIAHGLNPAIMGIKVAGSLGNAQELQMSYGIFEKNIIMPLRAEMTEIYNELLDIAGIQNNIVITNFQVIDNNVAEVPSVEQAIAGAVTSAVQNNTNK